MKYIKLFDSYKPISENLRYHIDNDLSLLENIFRPGSESFFQLIKEGRELYDNGTIELVGIDKLLFETTNLGKFAEYEGSIVPLDLPLENIEEVNESKYKGKEVDLNKPMRSSGPKKYKVYVRNPKTGNVKVVNFGDVKGGLTAKINDPKARKSFAARHKCSMKKDKTKAGYWACRLPRYKNLVTTSISGYW
jgi:hypothetical protein